MFGLPHRFKVQSVRLWQRSQLLQLLQFFSAIRMHFMNRFAEALRDHLAVRGFNRAASHPVLRVVIKWGRRSLIGSRLVRRGVRRRRFERARPPARRLGRPRN